MKIACVSTEMSPIAKVGGLADVSFGLSKEIMTQGHDICVILPNYASLKTSYLDSFEPYPTDLEITFSKKKHQILVWAGKLCGLTLFFIDSKAPSSFFQTDQIYGKQNDGQRFSFFSLAALKFIEQCHPTVDIIHINEWQTALIAPLYKEQACRKSSAKIMTTIHNLNYQGILSTSVLNKVGLSKKSTQLKCLDLKKHNKVNLLKSAIVYSDFITTVSPRYADEITTPGQGMGLDKIILENKRKIKGILNGIDYEVWNPKSDSALAEHYQLNHTQPKALCKKFIQKLLNMPLESRTPLVICICRLVPQKGISMIKSAISHVLKMGGQFILFGSSPIPKIQEDFDQLKLQLQDNPSAKLIFDSYNEELAHQLYAGADMIICPSIFEPCGLTQLISLRYGTVPIVRLTGGLANTVFDINSSSKANGFTYLEPTSPALKKTLGRAFNLYHHEPKKWKKLIHSGMKMDFSWKKSAQEYLKIFHRLIKKSTK